MTSTARGPYRICYAGTRGPLVDRLAEAGDEGDAGVDLVVEPEQESALTLVADAQRPADPRKRTPLSDIEDPFDCLVCTDDGGYDPVAFVERARATADTLPIVVLARGGDEQFAGRVVSAGASEYVPVDADGSTAAVRKRVHRACESGRERRRERTRRERAVRILEAVPEIVTVVSPGASITYQNGAIEEELGYSATDMTGRLPYERIDAADWAQLRAEFYDAVIDPSHVPKVEFRIEDADGEWRTVEARGRNLLDDPLIDGIVVSTRDVSDRKRREQTLERYREIAQNAGIAIYRLDADGRIGWVNDAFIEQIGYNRGFLEGTHVSAFLDRETIKQGRDLIRTLLREGRRWGRMEAAVVSAGDEFRECEVTITPLTDEGQFHGTVGVVRGLGDLT